MRTLKRNRLPTLLVFCVVLLVLGSIVLVGCGKNDDNNNNALLLLLSGNNNVTGYWAVTTNNGIHDSTSYMSLSQSGATVTGGYIIAGMSVDTTQISGSVSGSTVSLIYSEAGGWTRNLTGTIVGGSISNGTWSDSDGFSGTWSATSVGNIAVVSGHVSSMQGQYTIILSAGGPKTQILSSMTVAGPNIANQINIGPYAMITLSAKPSVGDTYTATISYSDLTSENITYTVDGIYENAPTITSPTDGAINVPIIPTFQFQFAGDTAYYSLMVMCGASWWSYEGLPSKTSVIFNEDGLASAPLPAGQACTLVVAAFDANDNSAFSSIGFTLAP